MDGFVFFACIIIVFVRFMRRLRLKEVESFLDSDELSEDEIHEGLSVIQKVSADHLCPKCGEKMRIRKTSGGTNAGKEFWVCQSFADCKAMALI